MGRGDLISPSPTPMISIDLIQVDRGLRWTGVDQSGLLSGVDHQPEWSTNKVDWSVDKIALWTSVTMDWNGPLTRVDQCGPRTGMDHWPKHRTSPIKSRTKFKLKKYKLFSRQKHQPGRDSVCWPCWVLWLSLGHDPPRWECRKSSCRLSPGRPVRSWQPSYSNIRTRNT